MSKFLQQSLTLLLIFCAISCTARAGGAKSITAPRADTPPTIDGSLDDPCWKTAAKGDGMILRSIGKQATEPTEFFVCYDKTSLYFAFYCHDSRPDQIRATQTERDADLWNDDFVRVYLDTYHQHRTAEEFIVNAIGTQYDERKRGTANKIGWKGDWHAAAKRVSDGWTAEIQIPFTILNYQPGATSMGLNIYRSQPRLGESSDWTYLDNDGQCIRFGDLNGLALPAPPRPKPQIMPYLLRTFDGGRNSGRVGLDIKQRFGVDSTALFTAFPDFGTVENAIQSIDFSYTAHRYGDSRPFFQEASSIFSSPYLYTTGIPDFDYGAKVFGQQGKVTYGLMGCSALGHRTDSMLSLLYDLPALTTARLNLVSRDDDTVNNKVLSLRLGGRPIPSTSWWVSGARSLTAGAQSNGSDFGAGFSSAGARWYCNGSYGRVSNHFNPADSYLDYPGSAVWDFGGGYEAECPGKSLRYYDWDFGINRRWDTPHGLIEESKDTGASLSFANHTSWGISHDWGRHIANYDDPPETGYRWNDDFGTSLSYNFRTDDLYRSGSLYYRWGEEGGGPSRTISAGCGFLPIKHFSTNLSIQQVNRENPVEGEVSEWLGILGARYELTAEKSLAARLLHRKEGSNITLSYRQRVRQGLDIFALYGDYNSDHTVNRLSIKFIASQ